MQSGSSGAFLAWLVPKESEGLGEVVWVEELRGVWEGPGLDFPGAAALGQGCAPPERGSLATHRTLFRTAESPFCL